MAYLDGELAPSRAVEAVAHLERCGECQRLAEELRGVSREMARWEVEGAEFGIREEEERAQVVPLRPKRRWWVWAGATAAAFATVLVFGINYRSSPRPAFEEFSQLEPQQRVVDPLKAPNSDGRVGYRPFLPADPEVLIARTAELIARTAEITIIVPDFATARSRLEVLLTARAGFSSHLALNTTIGRRPSMDDAISIPASQLDATLADLRKLGRVENESQTGTDVTAQTVDLEARLSNARNTEKSLIQLVADRSGGLKDVLAVEVELGRVRGEIESMEAQRKSLATQVERSTITVHISEEEHSQLGSNNIGLRLRNAAVDGVRSMRDSLIDTGVLIGSRGPVVLLWSAILFFPIRFAWRWWRSRRSA
jgi:hypothetical protein